MDNQENNQSTKEKNTQQKNKQKEKPSMIEQAGQNLAENFPKILGLTTLFAVPVLLAMVTINKINGG
jgi:hypothetical protein